MSEGVTTSIPLVRPCARSATCSEAVPFATAIPCLRPTSRANASSNAYTLAPCASIPDASTSLTAAGSSSPRIGRAIGIIGARNGVGIIKVRGWLAAKGNRVAGSAQKRTPLAGTHGRESELESGPVGTPSASSAGEASFVPTSLAFHPASATNFATHAAPGTCDIMRSTRTSRRGAPA